MENKIVIGLISASIAIIMVALVLSPVISDAIDDQHEFYNNSVGQFSKVVSDDVTIEYVADVENIAYTYSVNGVSQTTLSGYNDVLFATSGAMMKVAKSSSSISSYVVWYSEVGGSTRVDNPNSVTATITRDAIIATVVKSNGTSESLTIPIDWGFYAVTEGDYRAVWEPYDVYVNDITQVYSANWLNTTTEFFSLHGADAFYMGDTITADYDLSAVSGVVDVYNLASGDLTITVDNNGTPYVATPYVVIVPVEIVGDKSNHSDAISAILSAIIPLIIIAVALMAVSLTRRY